jgi:signal transduction histidine kinase/CheY-like chemotaxis protein
MNAEVKQFADLRERAESLLSVYKDWTIKNNIDSEESSLSIIELIHELEVHQTEIEIQNEELRRAQQEISDLQLEYEDLYEFAPCGYLSLNKKGGVTRANLTAANMFGVERGRLVLFGLGSFIDDEFMGNFYAKRKEAARTQTRQSLEIRIIPLNKRNSNEALWVQADIESDFNNKGEFQGWRVVLSEISQRKQLEQDLIEAKETAEQSNVAKSSFLSMMSHELRTPMNPIMGFIQLLLECENLTDEQLNWLKVMNKSSQSLLKLIEDILDISRIETDHLPLVLQAIDVRTFFNELAPVFLPTIYQKGLKFSLEIDGTVTPETLRLMDPNRLRQVLLNVVNNAIKFTQTGKIGIIVSLMELPSSSQDPMLQVRVYDTGPGIPHGEHLSIFEPFKQIDSSYTRKHGGVGLGLAICKKLVELMRGQIYVNVDYDEGAMIQIDLPAPRYIETSTFIAPEKELAPEARVENALLVEDDPSNALLIMQMLESMGIVVTHLSTGVEVERICEDESFDLILMDIRMPEMDGYEATKALRRKGVLTPIIAVTAHAFQRDHQACLNAGMDFWLTKPFGIQELKSAIAEAL